MRARADLLIPAVVAYIPLLLTSPGQVGADTKSYLYIDPDELLSGAASLWQPDTGLGTVTHQNIGYLWPMGPWFWIFEHAGIPDWVAQRLWLGTVLFLAACGVRYLLRTLGWIGPGVLVASLAFMCSPYVLHYSARISVLLLPWAGLPWMIALAERSVRSRGWRYPALFGLLVATIGSVNATSLLLVGVAPVLWLAHAAFVARTVSFRSALAASLRIGITSIGCSLWWIAGLVAQSGFSLPVTRYTETYEVIADASTAPEVFRGLGYWFFYGRDTFGPWVQPSEDYTNNLALLALSYGLPVAALLGAAFTRWAHRSFFLLLAGVGGLMAVAGHPYDDPSPLGRLFSDFTRTDAGLALRSTPRAVPLLALATAVMLGATVNALSVRARSRRGVVFRTATVVAVVANLPTLWTLGMVDPQLRFPEELPSYWNETAALLDSRNDHTRVLEVPGSDFATYRWGNTVDPVLSGLMDRPTAARELVPFGSGPSAALLGALDRSMQQGTFDPESLAPIARILSVGDIVYRADLEYERYRSPRPQPTWAALRSVAGLEDPIAFGADVGPNIAGPDEPLVDELTLNSAAGGDYPPAVAVFPVTDARPLITTVPASAPTIIVGDPAGLIDAAAAGLLTGDEAILFATTIAADPPLLESLSGSPQRIILTDSHRKQAQRWGAIREIFGATEVAGAEAVDFDPNDNRLPVFGEIEAVSDDERTVAEHRGVVEVTASDYGSRVSYTPESRPVLALDGDPSTSWTVGGFGEPRGERLVVRLAELSDAHELTVLQDQRPANRVITEIGIRLDRGSQLRVALNPDSFSAPGQVIALPGTSFDELEVEILETNVAPRPNYFGISAVGIAELSVDGIRVDEVIRLPVAWTEHLGTDPDRTQLDVVVTRERADPREPARSDPERSIVRSVTLPAPYEMTMAGDARISAAASEGTVADLVGWTTSTDGDRLVTTSSGHLPGDPLAMAAAAFDDDPDTMWTSSFGPQGGSSMSATRSTPAEVSNVEITVASDPTRSLPTTVTVAIDGVAMTTIDVPNSSDPTTTLRASFPPVLGRSVQVIVDGVVNRDTIDWYTGAPYALPVSIVDVKADGWTLAPPPEQFDTGCRADLLIVGSSPMLLRIAGTTSDALARRPLSVTGCEPVLLPAAATDLRAQAGLMSGIDLDQLVFSSSPDESVPVSATRRAVEVLDEGRTALTVRVDSPAEPTWLVLGQSHNAGWQARVRGGPDLGEPTLLDGYANGWLLDPERLGDGSLVIELEWTPQRVVRFAIAASFASVIASLVLAWRGRRTPPPAPRSPRLVGLARARVTATPRRQVVAVGLFVALGAAANLPDAPAWAVVIGLIVAVPLWFARPVAVPAIAAAGALVISALFHVVQQYRHDYPADFNWPILFERVHVLGVVALLALLAEVVRERIGEPEELA